MISLCPLDGGLFANFESLCAGDPVGAVSLTMLKAYGGDCLVGLDGGKPATAISIRGGRAYAVLASPEYTGDVLAAARRMKLSGATLSGSQSVGREITVLTADSLSGSEESATPDDAAEISLLATGSTAAAGDIKYRLHTKAMLGSVIRRGGEIVSCALTSGLTGECAVISAVTTKEQFRRLGFGERVVKGLASLAKRPAFVLTDSERTEQWYKGMGFAESPKRVFETEVKA